MSLRSCDQVAPEGVEMSHPVIRHAEEEDYEAIIDCVDDWWGGRQMALMLPKLFFVHFRPTSFVAEESGIIVGFVISFVSQTVPDEGYIHFLGVHPDFRKRDLGSALYESVFDRMIGIGCRMVRCVTSPLNKGSIAFHLKMGFNPENSGRVVDGIPISEDYDGPGEDRVLFSKLLKIPGTDATASDSHR
ncbi:MAG TPA: GNAT family N-acetyltransferase [Terriglobales bacterium]|nr:GNAT family N-acetyltransferase [Terriglobales bacterium]